MKIVDLINHPIFCPRIMRICRSQDVQKIHANIVGDERENTRTMNYTRAADIIEPSFNTSVPIISLMRANFSRISARPELKSHLWNEKSLLCGHRWVQSCRRKNLFEMTRLYFYTENVGILFTICTACANSRISSFKSVVLALSNHALFTRVSLLGSCYFEGTDRKEAL